MSCARCCSGDFVGAVLLLPAGAAAAAAVGTAAAARAAVVAAAQDPRHPCCRALFSQGTQWLPTRFAPVF